MLRVDGLRAGYGELNTHSFNINLIPFNLRLCGVPLPQTVQSEARHLNYQPETCI